MISSITRSFRVLERVQSLNKTTKCALSTLIRDRALINGEWVSSNETFDVTNPVNGKVITSVPDLGSQETEKAIDLAYEAFQSWRWTTAKERSNLLRKWFDLCMRHQEDLAKILTAEQGKSLAESKGEIAYGSAFLEWFSEEARRMNGETVPSPTNTKQMIFIREPVGVAAIICPWNFPNAMITRKVLSCLQPSINISVSNLLYTSLIINNYFLFLLKCNNVTAWSSSCLWLYCSRQTFR